MSRVSFKLSPKVVRAGAGCGKTTRLIEEVFCLSKNFKRFHKRWPRLVVCTFTKKAAFELKERLTEEALKQKDFKLLEYIQSPGLSVSTLHGVFHSFLKNYGWRRDLSPDFQVISEAQEKELLEQMASPLLFSNHFSLLRKIPFYHLTKILKVYVRCRLNHPAITFYDTKDFLEFASERDRILNQKTVPVLKNLQCVSPSQNDFLKSLLKDAIKEDRIFEKDFFIPFFKEFEGLGKEFFEKFLEHKKRSGLLTADDLELFLFDLINTDRGALEAISKERDYWFIDEYQDTSRLQERIIQKITQFKNIFCVGDPGQSIYLFRNADPEVFDRRLKNHGRPPIDLNWNYRSRSDLIWFFNDFFSSKKSFLKFSSPQKTIASKNHQNSSDSFNTSGGSSDPTTSFTHKSVKTSTPAESPFVYFISYPKDSLESAFQKILNHIQRLIAMGESHSDIAVLSTRNKDLSALSLFLTNKDIPSVLHAAAGFSRKRILLDSLFLYKFLINPYDSENFIALLRTPCFRISDESLSRIVESFEKEKDSFLWEYCLKAFSREKSVESLKSFLALSESTGLMAAFEKAVLEKILTNALALPPASRAVAEASLWKLLNHLHKRRKSGRHPLEFYYSFIQEHLSDEECLEAPLSNVSSAVQLLTIHGSKGLEFKNVIVFNLSSRFPSHSPEAVCDSKRNRMAFSVPDGSRHKKKIKCYGHVKINREVQIKEREESDRQLYVAMTRAKNSVCLLVPEGKRSQNTWLQRFSFFDNFYENDKNFWKVREGLYKKENYSFLVERDIKLRLKSPLPFLDSPLKTDGWSDNLQRQTEGLFKSSKDFILFQSEEGEKSAKGAKKEPPSFLRTNVFLKSQDGNHLHYYLRLLNCRPYDKVRKQLKLSFLSRSQKSKIQQAMDYVVTLKQPDMSFFLKQGFSEWSFQFKERGFVLRGQIDLWGWKDDEIHLFDYKSSSKAKEKTRKQLYFYAYVLERIYKAPFIKCFAIYPFQKEIEAYPYDTKVKKDMFLWLKSLKHPV